MKAEFTEVPPTDGLFQNSTRMHEKCRSIGPTPDGSPSIFLSLKNVHFNTCPRES